MTTEEAIVYIKIHKDIHKLYEPNAVKISEALDMAIEALEHYKGDHDHEKDTDNISKDL